MEAKRKEKQEQQRAETQQIRLKPPVPETPIPKVPPRPIVEEKKTAQTVVPTPSKVAPSPVPPRPEVKHDVKPQQNIVPPKGKEEAVFSAPIYGDTDFPKPSVPTPERKGITELPQKPQMEPRVITPAVTDDQFFDDFFSDDDDE